MKHIVFLPDIEYSNDFLDVLRKSSVPFHLIGKKKWHNEDVSRGSLSSYWTENEDFTPDAIVEQIQKIKKDFSLKSDQIHLIGLREHSIEIIGEVTERTKCIGISKKTADLFRDKWLMMNKAAELGIETPITVLAESGWQLPFPSEGLILKPRNECSAKNVEHCRSQEVLEKLISQLEDPSSYIIQNFVPGHLFFINGVRNNNQTLMHCTGKYLTPLGMAGRTPRQFVKNWIASSSYLDNQGILEQIKRQHDIIADGFNLVAGCTHMEFFCTPGGRILFCEGAARPPGSGISNMEKLLLGKRTSEVWASLIAENDSDFPETGEIVGMIAYTPECPVISCSSLQELDETWILRKEEIPASKVLGGHYSSSLGNIFITSSTTALCEKRLNKLDTWFNYEPVKKALG